MKFAMLECKWDGPFGWPEMEGTLPPVPPHRGVYLLTVEYQKGYLIYAAGLTRRPMPKRFREHTREYMNGVYNVLDIAAMKAGVRHQLWHGFWMIHRPRKRVAEFKRRQRAIQAAACKQLADFRIFAASISPRKRILERLEAAIMDCLYKQPKPFCELPDKGMRLMPRRKSEKPIIIKNRCSSDLFWLPGCLEI
jgi:hypothetical protein